LERNSLRADLRHGTADIHQRLDARIGHFADRQSYCTYLANTYRFRQQVEPALGGHAGWSARSILAELRQDLVDLGAEAPSSGAPPLSLSDPSALLGAFYVLEGSGLGARLLFRRAEALGLSAAFGARHLAHQIAEPGRWRSFLDLLDRAAHVDRPLALAAAQTVFETALATHEEHVSE
jgi:heme oxygenase